MDMGIYTHQYMCKYILHTYIHMHKHTHVPLESSQVTQWWLSPGRQGSQFGQLQTFSFKPIVWFIMDNVYVSFHY